MLSALERDMRLRLSDYRFWLLLSALAIGALAACSSDTTTGGGADGSTEDVANSMTPG
jgi:hypothetical protein